MYELIIREVHTSFKWYIIILLH